MKTEGLGARMKWYRLERGLTQNDLAKELGVTPQAVSKWETGQGYPDVTLYRILQGFWIHRLISFWHE